jgi:hypothetical protein
MIGLCCVVRAPLADQPLANPITRRADLLVRHAAVARASTLAGTRSCAGGRTTWQSDPVV